MVLNVGARLNKEHVVLVLPLGVQNQLNTRTRER